MAMASGFEKIFEVGPVFRAENSNTNRHATEFTGFDLEFSYIDSYEDVMVMEEEMLTYALKAVKEQLFSKTTTNICFVEEYLLSKQYTPELISLILFFISF